MLAGADRARSGVAAAIMLVAENRLSATTRCHSAAVSSPGDTEAPDPAQATRISSRPLPWATASTTAAHAAGSVASPSWSAQSAPSDDIAASRPCRLRAIRDRRAPSRAKACAIASPMPRLPPEIKTDFPANSRFKVNLSGRQRERGNDPVFSNVRHRRLGPFVVCSRLDSSPV